MIRSAPPEEPEARRDSVAADAGRTLAVAAAGGSFALFWLAVVGQILALLQFFLVGVYGVWSWAKIGLLITLLSLRAEVIATLRGSPILPETVRAAEVQVRFVPLVLTIGFLWLAARAGRRAARERSGRSALLTAALAAAGAGVPVAAVAALAGSLVRLSFPDLGPNLGLTVRVDEGTVALWAGTVAAAGVGLGAYLEAGRGRFLAAVLRGGLVAYAWALGLLVVGVLVLATLEPNTTRAYVDGLAGRGPAGEVLFAAHVLAFPAQSALLLAPASGSCLEILGAESGVSLCPWSLEAVGPAPVPFLPEAVPLSPWCWLLNAVPPIAAILGGRRAASALAGRRPIAAGGAAGVVFAVLALLGAWFVIPRVLGSGSLPLSFVTIQPAWVATAVTSLIWGLAGGTVGGWLAGRGYEGPGSPKPTSV